MRTCNEGSVVGVRWIHASPVRGVSFLPRSEVSRWVLETTP